jgi:hypothetical protein
MWSSRWNCTGRTIDLTASLVTAIDVFNDERDTSQRGSFRPRSQETDLMLELSTMVEIKWGLNNDVSGTTPLD